MWQFGPLVEFDRFEGRSLLPQTNSKTSVRWADGIINSLESCVCELCLGNGRSEWLDTVKQQRRASEAQCAGESTARFGLEAEGKAVA